MKLLFLTSLLFVSTFAHSEYIVYPDSNGYLQVMSLKDGNVKDTRTEVPKDYTVVGKYVLYNDGSGDLQILDITSGKSSIDTRVKVPANFKPAGLGQ